MELVDIQIFPLEFNLCKLADANMIINGWKASFRISNMFYYMQLAFYVIVYNQFIVLIRKHYTG